MIDLHCHSLFSDGSQTPEEIAAEGGRLGLSALALTDHDTVDGLERFLACQPGLSTRLLPGIELSCAYLGRSLHVVGLFVDPGDARFRERLVEWRTRRVLRNEAMVRRLNELGVPVRLEDVAALAPTDLVSRVHFAQAIVAAGAASSPDEAFKRWIGDHAPGYVPRKELSPEEAATWIREAGGVPLVAHPGRFSGRSFRWEEAFLELQALGMRGLEAYYGDYSPAEQDYFTGLAARTGMLRSGGSDSHGANRPDLALGKGRGSLQVPDQLLDDLEAARP